jgi:hypothetical protein
VTRWLKSIYQALPVIRELQQIRDSLWALRGQNAHQLLIRREAFLRRLIATSAKYQDPRVLNHFEFQIFSQNGEDGIIAEIFRRVGSESRCFVECAAGEGVENNTAFLLRQGWRGVWMEADPRCVQRIRSQFAEPLAAGHLKLLPEFTAAETIVSQWRSLDVPEEFDFLSLDIDRNTSHVWRALKSYRPRVVSVEYNATFPPDVSWEVPYAAERVWNRTTYFGASLKALELIGRDLGYSLVGCDLSGTNAFFVRSDLNLSAFVGPFTAETHYEPPRYWTGLRSAHPSGFSD